MSAKRIFQDAIALPLAERVALAQSLWQSIEGRSAGNISEEVKWAVEEAERRDSEFSSGGKIGRTHDEVMRAAREAIE